MFIYSMTLIRLNRRYLPAEIRMPWWRLAIMAVVVVFFGFFSVWAMVSVVKDILTVAVT